MFFQILIIFCVYSEELKTSSSGSVDLKPSTETTKKESQFSKTINKKEAYEESYTDPTTGQTVTNRVRNTFSIGKIPSLEISPPPDTTSPASGNKGKATYKPKSTPKKPSNANIEASSEGETPNFDELNKLMEGLGSVK